MPISSGVMLGRGTQFMGGGGDGGSALAPSQYPLLIQSIENSTLQLEAHLVLTLPAAQVMSRAVSKPLATHMRPCLGSQQGRGQ